MGLAAAGFPQEQENSATGQARRLEHSPYNPLEFLAGALVNRLHVERVVFPDIVGVGDGVEELGIPGRTERGDPAIDRVVRRGGSACLSRDRCRHEGTLSDPYEMKRGAQIVYLGLPNIVGIHGLDQVGPAQVQQPRIVGLGEAFLESSQLHGRKRRIDL
jgi:hypothetical protein